MHALLLSAKIMSIAEKYKPYYLASDSTFSSPSKTSLSPWPAALFQDSQILLLQLHDGGEQVECDLKKKQQKTLSFIMTMVDSNCTLLTNLSPGEMFSGTTVMNG